MTLQDVNLEGVQTLLLDRDGVINRLRVNDYVKCWDEFEFLPGVLDAIAKAAEKVSHIFIVTNQRGVGKGLMTERDLMDIHRKMLCAVQANGGRIDGIYYCTAVDPANPRRKPNSGMFHEILRQFPDVAPSTTLMVGDSESDRQFAYNCGIQFQLVTY